MLLCGIILKDSFLVSREKREFITFYNYVKWNEKEMVDTLLKEYNWMSDYAYGKNQWRMGDELETTLIILFIIL